MALAQYTPKTKVVKIGDTTIKVKGLGLDQLGEIIADHKDDLLPIFMKFQHGELDASSIDGANLITTVVNNAPELIQKVIILASGELASDNSNYDTLVDAVSTMTIGDQLAVVMAVVELTFTEPGTLKKTLGSLPGIMPTP